jgi:hypothetical protein
MKPKELEEKIIRKVLPEIEEKVAYRIGKKIIQIIQEEIYPPESAFRKEFIKSVKEAEKRIKHGKSKKFKNARELERYLKSLAR